MQTVEELQAHYKAVRARLNGIPCKEPAIKPLKELAIDPLKEIAIEPQKFITNGEKIVMETAAKHKISPKDIKADIRKKKFVKARWECMYRLKNELNLSLSSVGKFMKKDHTTVLYAIRKYEKTRQQVAG